MMRVALDAARKAVASHDIPVGAAIFNNAGELVATGHNERELHNDPTAHAEIVAIRNAAEKLGDWHLTDHTLVVTLEPCAMCAGAIAQSRLQTVVFGAWTTENGYVIAIQHSNDLVSIYKHNAVLLKKVGNFVRVGEPVAIVGSTGELSNGPHLHFELWYRGNAVNPINYIHF